MTSSPARRLRFGLAAFGLLVLTVCSGPAVAADGGRPVVGDEAPDFTLSSTDGSALTLSSMRGEKKILLVFFRGTW